MRFFLMVMTFLSVIHVNGGEDIDDIGSYQNSDIVITYGQITQSNGDVDGAIYIESFNEEINNKYIEYDDMGIERFIYVADIGNNEFIAVCERMYNSDDYHLPVFKDVLLIKYDVEGNRLAYLKYEESPKSYYNHNHYLVVEDSRGNIEYVDEDFNITNTLILNAEFMGQYQGQYQGQAYVNGVMEETLYIDYPGYYEIKILDDEYEYLYNVAVNPMIEISGTQFEEMYIDGVSIHSLGEIYLNDVLYTNHEMVTIPGNYTISVYGINDYLYQEDFVLLPNITYNTTGDIIDFIDGLIVEEPINIYSNGISMVVDNEAYYSELISDPGIHSITIYGINGMQYSLSFTILANVLGVVDGGVYESVNFTVYGEAILNGEAVTGNVYVNEPGNYTLDIYQNQKIQKTINFEITSTNDIVEEKPLLDFNFNYLIFAFIAIGGYLILRKK